MPYMSGNCTVVIWIDLASWPELFDDVPLTFRLLR